MCPFYLTIRSYLFHKSYSLGDLRLTVASKLALPSILFSSIFTFISKKLTMLSVLSLWSLL